MSSPLQHLQKVANDVCFFSGQWHPEGHGKTFHLQKASWYSRLALRLKPLLSKRMDCRGSRGSPISEPCNTGLYNAAIPMSEGACKKDYSWRMAKTLDENTSFQQQLQLLYPSSCRCLEKKSHWAEILRGLLLPQALPTFPVLGAGKKVQNTGNFDIYTYFYIDMYIYTHYI